MLHPILRVMKTRLITSPHRFNNGFSPSFRKECKNTKFSQNLRLFTPFKIWENVPSAQNSTNNAEYQLNLGQ